MNTYNKRMYLAIRELWQFSLSKYKFKDIHVLLHGADISCTARPLTFCEITLKMKHSKPQELSYILCLLSNMLCYFSIVDTYWNILLFNAFLMLISIVNMAVCLKFLSQKRPTALISSLKNHLSFLSICLTLFVALIR